MATTNLQDYLKLIDQLLEDGRFYEASQHCRQILQQYPRHIPTYRALAKALLEQRQYSNASDLFHRILSADPHDFIAHVGLALIHREEQHLPQAIWHMQRAFELAPYNGSIQEELQGLYAAQNRRVKETIAPNRCALAHLYMRSELYAMAVTELQSIRQEEAYAGRIDLDVLLAEAFWRNGQQVEAVTTCLKVLEQLPNCIQVNAILAEIWLLTGRIDEAQTYFQRLQALLLPSKTDLDVETAVGRAFCTPGAPPLPEQASVTSLDSLTAVTDSIDSSAADLEQDIADEESQDDLYDWLQALQAPEGATPDKGAGKHAPDKPNKDESWLTAKAGQPATTPEEDWLAELENVSLPELSTAAQPASAEQPVIPLAELPEEPIAPIAKIPTWMLATDDSLTELDADSAVDWLKLDELEDSDISIQVVVEDQTDWFSDPSKPRVKPQTDWFVDQTTSSHKPEPEATADIESDAQADVSWLAEPEEAMQPARVETAELNEWLAFTDELDKLSADGLADEEVPSPEAIPAIPPADEDESVPQWLMTAPLTDESVAEESADFASSGVPDWLMTGPLETAVNAAPTAEPLPDDEADVSAWLAEATITSFPVVEAAEPLDLSQLSATPGLATSELAGDEEILPEWLQGGETSAWLSQEAEDEADDEFIDALFGNLPFDLMMDDDEDAAPQEAAIPTEAGGELSAAPLWGDESAPSAFTEEKDDSSELPSWLFSSTWRDSDSLVSDTGSVGLDELSLQPGLVSGELHADNASPDWLASTDSIGEKGSKQTVEPTSTSAFLSFSDKSEAVDERENFAALADPEMTADVPLQKRSSGLLNWLSDLPVDTGEMEALTMADKDEMASLPPEPEDAHNLAGTGEPGDMDWLQELAAVPGPEELEPGAVLEPAELPDWLKSLSGPLTKGETAVPILDELIQDEVEAEDKATGVTSMLDWLQQGEDAAGADAAADVPPDEFALDIEGDEELPGSEISWLDALLAEQEETPPPLSQAPESVWAIAQPAMDEPGKSEADSFDWLQELDMAEEPEDSGAAAEADYNWLTSLETPLELETAVGEAAFALESTADVSDDWLAELSEAPTTDDWLPQAETAVDEAAFALESAADVSDDWLAELSEAPTTDDWLPQAETAAGEAAFALESTADVSDDWLAELSEAPTTDDWLPQAETAVGEAAFALESTADVSDDWLAELSEAPTTDDWLPQAETAVGEAAFALESTADVSDDWLAELSEAPTTDDWLPQAETAVGEAAFALESTADVSDDWLAELSEAPTTDDWLPQAETAVGEAAFALESTADVSDDWLAELSEAPTTDDWLPQAETAVGEAAFALDEIEETPVTEWQDELISERTEISSDLFAEEEKEDVLAWLDSLTLDSLTMEKADEATFDAAAPAATTIETIIPLADAEVEDEKEALAWLGDLAEEPVTESVEELVGRVEERALSAADAQATQALDEAQAIVAQASAEAELPEIVFPEDAMFPRDVGVPTDVPEELDDTMAWLAELVAEQGLSLDDLAPEPAKLAKDTAVPISEPATVPSAEIDDAMAWLDHLAEEQGTPIEALPTVADRVLAEAEEPAPAAELAAAELTAPYEEGEAAVIDELASTLDWLEEIALASAAEVTLDANIQVIDPAATDLLSALDWVEQQLRIPAGAPLELDINIDEIPEDPEQALAWLAGMAEVEKEVPPISKTGTAVSPAPLLETQEVVDLTLVDDIPDDPEAAVRWLEDLAVDESPVVPPLPEAEAKTAFVLPTTEELPEIVFPEDAMFPRDVGVPTDVPEELEDSMDWLQTLMAEQGLSLDDLGIETAVMPAPEPAAETLIAPEEPAEPAVVVDELLSTWGTEAETSAESELGASAPATLPDSAPAERETGTAIAEASELSLDFLLKSEPGTLSWLDEFAAEETGEPLTAERLAVDLNGEEEPDSTVREILSGLESNFHIQTELSDSWPEWLNLGEESTPGLGETGWLKSFGESDVSSWLTAEDEITSSAIIEDVSLPPVKFPNEVPFEAGEPVEIPSLFGDVSTLDAASHLSANDEQLRMAQAAMKAGDLNAAMKNYQLLIETGSGLGLVIADLETAVKQNPRHAALRRLLGDAYMRNGQLQKALDTYRQALGLL